MILFARIAPILWGLGLAAICTPAAAECEAPSVPIDSADFEGTGTLKVRAGTGCRFSIGNVPGVVQKTRIVQAPKAGKAGVIGLIPFYAASHGYRGPDEFAYEITGFDQYGGPMNVTVTWKVTVIP